MRHHHQAIKPEAKRPSSNICPAPDLGNAWPAKSNLIGQVSPGQHEVATVIVDAGHGFIHGSRFDSGTTKGNHYEADITMAEARAVANELKNRGYRVVLTRDDGDEPHHDRALARKFESQCHALAYRVQVAAKAAKASNSSVFISLHADSWPTQTAHGISIYNAPNDDKSKALNHEMAAAFNDHAQVRVHANAADIYVLRWNKEAHIPALLIETGFTSNQQDLARITSEKGRIGLAKSVADGVDNFLRRPISVARR